MSARDFFHEVVKTALQKEGWQITHDPFRMRIDDIEMLIDLGAEQLIAAEQEGRKIAVEIKSFLESTSAISEFHKALGQFINYRAVLRLQEPERVLYLAIPLTAYSTFFRREFPRMMIEENQVNLIIYDAENEVITEWRN